MGYDYDAHGHLLKVSDSATGFTYWRLTNVGNAGRFQKEVFGNGAVTERSYFADKQTLKNIVTQSGVAVQRLGYEYDAGLNLVSRADALQTQYSTERFRYDVLERLTWAYFSLKESPLAPCALSYDYAPNGNLNFKSDVGALAYGNPAHPHAVTSADGDNYSYNAVGNQVTRPGGVTDRLYAVRPAQDHHRGRERDNARIRQ